MTLVTGAQEASIPTRATIATSQSPSAARPQPSRTHARSAAAAGLGLALLLSLAPGGVIAPAGAEAASSCGSWESRSIPPPSIRVLRTRTGRVEQVDLRRYVAVVMASGEWPTWMSRAALEVGATAVKQYAWYYALTGHHREGYRTSSGTCYDVRDDVIDQLYRPETADATPRQLAALEDTWALSLRKWDRFFLTGYRAGDAVACGRDADGWRLYEKSVEDCAQKGWSRERIQQVYYSPGLRFVWAGSLGGEPRPVDLHRDEDPPVVHGPRVGLRRGATLGERIVQLRWSGRDGGSGLDRWRLQRSVDGAAWRRVALTRRTATATALEAAVGREHRFRLLAEDVAGNSSGWSTSEPVVPQVLQTRRARLVGAWSAASRPRASGGWLRTADAAGARAVLRFTGRSVAIVGPVGPRYGRLRVRIDGRVVATVDLQRSSHRTRRLVWTRSWSATRERQISVIVLSTPDRPRVGIDAFVVLR